MKHRRRIVSVLLAVLLVLGMTPAAWAAPADKTVTLRIEFAESTMQEPVTLDMPVKTFAAYGLADVTDPGYATPLHVLAAYMEQTMGATAEDMAGYITAPGGWLNAILGSNGSEINAEGVYWMFSVNGTAPVNPDTGWGYGIAEYPVQAGDILVIYGVWGGSYPSVPSYTADFDCNAYTVEAGDPLQVRLSGYDNFAQQPAVLPGATVQAGAAGDGAVGTTVTQSAVTDAEGRAILTFDTPGVYPLSAVRAYTPGTMDISRPYALVTVTEADHSADETLVQTDKQALVLQGTYTGNIDLPRIGASGKTHIDWASSNPAVVANDGTVTRPAIGQADAVVELTATVRRGTQMQTKSFTVRIPAQANTITNIQVSQGELAFDPDTLDYTVKVERGAEVEIAFTQAAAGGALQVTGATKKQDGVYVLDEGGNPRTVTAQITGGTEQNVYTITFHTPARALSELSSEWNAFRGANYGVTDAPTPQDAAHTALQWKQNLAGELQWASMGAPLLIDGKIYISVNDTLMVLDTTGRLCAQAKLAGSVGYFSYAAYGDGMLFVPIDQGRIQALDAKTLESLWVTESVQSSYQASSPLVYQDGMLYTGLVEYISTTKTNGLYVAYDVTDEDPTLATESKSPVWTHQGTGESTGYYWSGGALAPQSILFAGDDGVLVSHARKEDRVLSTVALDGAVRSGVVYDAAGQRAYVATQTGRIYAVAIKTDGTLTMEAQTQTHNGQGTTATPVVAGDRLYVLVSGAYGEESVLEVRDKQTLALLDSVSVGGYSQSSPLVSTASGTVRIYVALNDGTSRVQVVTDQGETLGVQTLYAPEQADQNYCATSLIAGQDGAVYFINDSGLLFALKACASSGTDGDGGTPDIPKTGEKDADWLAWTLLAMGAGACWLYMRRQERSY